MLKGKQQTRKKLFVTNTRDKVLWSQEDKDNQLNGKFIKDMNRQCTKDKKTNNI